MRFVGHNFKDCLLLSPLNTLHRILELFDVGGGGIEVFVSFAIHASNVLSLLGQNLIQQENPENEMERRKLQTLLVSHY
jgi:hypothetical protein